ncbi:AtpZ/AtpI family protein [Paenibacillus sp. GCM10012307]|uniref:AtpZ/AtpI family protein n=1 Tax=Paenibacillus roseus TaxID=2798579 RepID=A0A934J7N4_9BACL|nr:AtpZ/AtpI family protein [Paenibacillus roseus]MBJ6361880.1 AtpZ/AtpI family protein [Paenibacillus roseus]
MNPKNKRDNPLLAAGMVGVLGMNVAICMCLGYFVGSWLGGSKGWTVLGLLTGLAVGILSCILLVKKVLEDTDG